MDLEKVFSVLILVELGIIVIASIIISFMK